MPRLFAGFEIPTEIVERLARWRAGLPGARWTDPANYHLTLRFIGDIDGHTADEIDTELAELRLRAPIPVIFEAFDVFGGDRPHALHVRAKLTPELADLQAEIERRLRRAGLAPEKRKFVPHVTLARLRGVDPLIVASYIARQGQFPELRFTAGHVSLFSARDMTGGGPYLVEAAYPFTGMEMVAYR